MREVLLPSYSRVECFPERAGGSVLAGLSQEVCLEEKLE